MSFFMLIRLAVALWLYRDARKWGYSQSMALLWGAATVVVPYYIALVVYLLFGRKYQLRQREKKEDYAAETIEAEVISAGTFVDCPMCASKVGEEQTVCPRCGYTLVPVCSKCGRRLEREWKTCPYCQQITPEK
ncbi:MAG: double zinc ribbon domain-containing protein [Selenomonadaceae bacterium]